MSYSLLHVLHLLGAIAFIGTLFFEVIILAKVKPQLAPGAVAALEQALGMRLLDLLTPQEYALAPRRKLGRFGQQALRTDLRAPAQCRLGQRLKLFVGWALIHGTQWRVGVLPRLHHVIHGFLQWNGAPRLRLRDRSAHQPPQGPHGPQHRPRHQLNAHGTPPWSEARA